MISIVLLAAGLLLLPVGIDQLTAGRHRGRPARVPEHVGATEHWSPEAEVSQAPERVEAPADIEMAHHEIEPLLAEFDAAMAEAMHAFRLGTRQAMRTAWRWHEWSTTGEAPVACVHPDCDSHAWLARWRADTPTSEWPIVVPSRGWRDPTHQC